ncbi:MAG TPA: DUF3810 domain-containing protein [Ferruginibacter sp.]|nr:DUF3810 domain-containing protein [Ferruginibacter sp.]
MKLRKSLSITLILVIIAVSIHFFSLDPVWVETHYATGLYPYISRTLRFLLGWLPFSAGDIMYGGLVLWLIIKLVKLLRTVIRRKATKEGFTGGLIYAINFLLVVYISFNLLWGINYNRMGIARQLGLKMEKYSADDLKKINELLLAKVNESKQALLQTHAGYPSKQELFTRVSGAYARVQSVYPFLAYQPVSLKPSVWSWLGNYMGFTGYYNPFTGEAQVNTLVPKFLQPFTTSHEVAHQLGYAKEMEANFVGYLAASSSNDTLLHYSVYLDLFMYSNRNLFETDSVAAKEFRKQLMPAVQDDLKEWKRFYLKHQNPFEPVFRWIYGVYLRRNQQPQGVLSYDEVTGFLIAYYKKTGKI